MVIQYPSKDDLQIIGRKCLKGEHVEKKQIWERDCTATREDTLTQGDLQLEDWN